MGQYRKKPIEVEARQFVSDRRNNAETNADELMTWIQKSVGDVRAAGVSMTPDDDLKIRIATLEGMMTANLGDWIIRGVQGEFYPCKPDIFEATYVSVEIPGSGSGSCPHGNPYPLIGRPMCCADER